MPRVRERVCCFIWGGYCHGHTTPLCKDFQKSGNTSDRQTIFQVNFISINCYSCLPNKITWVHVTQGITGCHQAVPKVNSQNKQSFQPQPSGSFSLFLIYINLKKRFIVFMCIHVFPALWMCIIWMCLVPTEIRRGCQVPETRVTEGCELPCRCWELNSDTLEEQLVLLSPEPSLQSILISFLFLEQWT